MIFYVWQFFSSCKRSWCHLYVKLISAVSVNNANLAPIWDKRFVCVKELPVYFTSFWWFFFFKYYETGRRGKSLQKKGKKTPLWKYLHKLTFIMEMEFINRNVQESIKEMKWNKQPTVSENCMWLCDILVFLIRIIT